MNNKPFLTNDNQTIDVLVNSRHIFIPIFQLSFFTIFVVVLFSYFSDDVHILIHDVYVHGECHMHAHTWSMYFSFYIFTYKFHFSRIHAWGGYGHIYDCKRNVIFLKVFFFLFFEKNLHIHIHHCWTMGMNICARIWEKCKNKFKKIEFTTPL